MTTEPDTTDTVEQRELITILTNAIRRHQLLTHHSPNPDHYQEPAA